MNEHPPAAVPKCERFSAPGDELARQFFTAEDLALSPEEYVARNAQNWGCFSFHEYPYRDAALGRWVKRVGELLGTDGEVERCRLEHLTSDELATVLARQADDF